MGGHLQKMKLEVDGVTRTYHSDNRIVEALKSCAFTIDHADFVVFLGPSGCGKSTLLNIISGLEQPTSGQVILDGEAMTGPSPDIGMVFQQYTLFPWLTVEKNAAFADRLKCNGAKGQLENDRPRNIATKSTETVETGWSGRLFQSLPEGTIGGHATAPGDCPSTGQSTQNPTHG